MLGGIETGYRLGRKSESRFSDRTKSHVSAISATLLGILALLLGFTISMAVSRYEKRTQLVLEEANAIGTAYLRTHLLPAPDGAPLANLLTEYVDSRLRLRYVAISQDLHELIEAREQWTRLKQDIWDGAVTYARKDPNMVTSGLLLQTLNEAIDLESSRWMAFNNQVPEAIVYLNGLVALLAVNMLGYTLGLGRQRQLYSTSVLALAITVVMIVSLDLDRPRQGMVHVSQQPMIDLQQHLPASKHQ